MTHLSAYIPLDRRVALAHGVDLPNCDTGAALFADISGFTPLTERLTLELGPRRGTEELTRQINAVYDALIAAITQPGGSVISFAGDAITCWFDADSGGRAAAAGLAMQAAMTAFPHLALKVSVTSGPVRRFVVGDPAIQRVDVLAGATVARLATGEHLAARGEVLVDAPTAAAVGAAAMVREWRTAETGERFAVLQALPAPGGDFTLAAVDLPAANLRPWVLPAVFEREQGGHGAFLTELRPAVAMFLRFDGIDYDGDTQAGDKLDALIRAVQAVAQRYDGALLALIIGDKGSYVYLAFGALAAHEDDARRAALTALELRGLPERLPFLSPVQIGVSAGVMRVGAYGSRQRRTYGAIGDPVNLAARLMQAAAPGQIFLGETVHTALKGQLLCQPLPPLPVKGKSAPVAVWTLQGIGQHAVSQLHEPAYMVPMVGRADELALAGEKFALALQGRGQIVGITAEAGLGKSRLVAEILRLVAAAGPLTPHPPAIYAGACQSFGVNTPYLVWRDIWRGLFQLDATMPVTEQIHALAQTLAAIDPLLVGRVPLLGLVLDMPIPDNDLTRSFDAQLRKESLEALLVDYLKAYAQSTPLVLVLEDLHWLDPLSHDLLAAVGRVIANLPVMLVLAYRPPALVRGQAACVMRLLHATEIHLTEFTPPEAARLITLKLAQVGVPDKAALLQALKAKIIARAQGNPFFIEETLNYLHGKVANWDDAQAGAQLEWPDSLHTLVLSRIDQLTAHEKLTLKIASIIGRVFRVAWLCGYYPALGDAAVIKVTLTALHRLDITPLDTSEPELAYLFKHIVTQEVTYESLPYALRAQLHEALAQYLEALDAERYLNLLAFHYSRSANVAKQREYLRKAGETAQATYANEAALDYYARLLPLLTAPLEQVEIHLKRGAVWEVTGQWPEAEAENRAALALAEQRHDAAALARCRRALGVLCEHRGDYRAALAWLERARVGYETCGDRQGVGQTLTEIGIVFYRQGEYALARQQLAAGLDSARAIGDTPGMALALNHLGNVVSDQGEYAAARTLYEESLALRRALGDKRGIAASLNNLGLMAWNQDQSTAVQQALYAESLALDREMGDKRGIAISLNNLGLVAWHQGEYATARALYEESLALKREMGDKEGIAMSLINLGILTLHQRDYATARRLYAESLALKREMGDKEGIALACENLGNVALAQRDAAAAHQYYAESLALAQAVGDQRLLVYALGGLAAVRLGRGDTLAAAQVAAQLAAASETLRVAIHLTREPDESQIYEDASAAALAQLGAAAFNAAWAVGAKLTLAEALALALQAAQ